MLGAATLLEVWESAQNLEPSARALLFLNVATPLPEPSALADLTIGQRDLRLLQWRKALFGPHLEIQTRCTACQEILDATLDLDEFDLSVDRKAPADQSINIDGSIFHIRPPTIADVASLPADMANDKVVATLLETCVATDDGSAIIPEQLGSATIAKLAERMAELDSAADIVVTLACPYCNVTSGKVLDIAHVLLREIASRARQVLQDVHAIATSYGWAEHEILALSAVRRRAYLDMIAT